MGVERVSIAESVGRVTAGPVRAAWSSPAHDLAAMDGIAVRAVDTTGASEGVALRLPPSAYDVVDTGDPLPDGRDAVVMREHTRPCGAGVVEIDAAVRPGRHVRRVGEDVTTGELLLPAVHRIRGVDAAVVAGAGHAELDVRRRPVIAILPTGDEVRPIGSRLRRGEVLDTNSLLLAEQARDAGATAVIRPIVPDDPDALAAAIRDAACWADLVAVIAGSSKGRDDHTATVLRGLGQVAVHGVAMRPGHPVMLGALDRGFDQPTVPFIGIPGYPVSAARTFTAFACPLIRLLQGLSPERPVLVTARLAQTVTSPPGVEQCVSVRLESLPSGELLAVPTGHGAAALSTLMHADGLLVIAAASTCLAEGTDVAVEHLPGAPADVPADHLADAPRAGRASRTVLQAVTAS